MMKFIQGIFASAPRQTQQQIEMRRRKITAKIDMAMRSAGKITQQPEKARTVQ